MCTCSIIMTIILLDKLKQLDISKLNADIQEIRDKLKLLRAL